MGRIYHPAMEGAFGLPFLSGYPAPASRPVALVLLPDEGTAQFSAPMAAPDRVSRFAQFGLCTRAVACPSRRQSVPGSANFRPNPPLTDLRVRTVDRGTVMSRLHVVSQTPAVMSAVVASAALAHAENASRAGDRIEATMRRFEIPTIVDLAKRNDTVAQLSRMLGA